MAKKEPEKEEIKKPETGSNIVPREITTELKDSYLMYAMSVIVSRALPDVRDGLKPVHRRILYTMHELGLGPNAKTRKSAKIVGDVTGNYHPHGTIAVYESLVKLAQDFGMRYPLVIGQGNFGSIDGDNAAADRYTEAKMSRIGTEILRDIEKETVDWRPNYEGTRQEPVLLPAAVPNLLLNGTLGIAVGMATNIPPHNLSEVVDAASHLIDHPKATAEDLMEYIKGPDFPTGGIIYNKKEIVEAYTTGRGGITMRGVAEIKEKDKGKGYMIEISEIPFQVNKAALVTHMAELVQEKKIDGIKDIRDESDKEKPVSIVVELKSDAVPQKVLNQLYKHTDLQKNFNMNMVALVDKGLQPQVLSLKDVLAAFIGHRQEVVRRRGEYDLKKAKEREHILEGLSKALHVIDRVIETIKKSKSREDALANLRARFKLTEIQANAILDMRLATLAALERQKIEDELAEKRKLIAALESLLKSEKKILDVIKGEMQEIKEKYGDERRTKVVLGGLKDIAEEDLIKEEETMITLSQGGYIKRVDPNSFKQQHRGGKGLIGSEVSDEDFLAEVVYANTHDNILFFTDRGRVFQTKVYEIPAASRTAKGKPIHNFLEIPIEEKVNAVVAYPNKVKEQGGFLTMVTERGVIKKTPLTDFSNVRRTGIIAIKLRKEDVLRWVKWSSGKDEVILTTLGGQAIRFKETDVRSMGRASSGVTGIRLKNKDLVSSMNVIKKETDSKTLRLLVVMEKGYGKQTPISQYKVQRRGGSGILTAKVTDKTGRVIDAWLVSSEEEILALSAKGQVIRTELKTVRLASRATQGVRIMNLNAGDKLVGIICF